MKMNSFRKLMKINFFLYQVLIYIVLHLILRKLEACLSRCGWAVNWFQFFFQKLFISEQDKKYITSAQKKKREKLIRQSIYNLGMATDCNAIYFGVFNCFALKSSNWIETS